MMTMRSLAFTLVVLSAACSSRKETRPDYFAGDQAARAVRALLAKIPDPAPRALELRITRDRVYADVENARQRGTLQRWTYHGGKVYGPQKVMLSGDPRHLAAQLFEIRGLDVTRVPAIAAEARKLWNTRKIQDMRFRIPEVAVRRAAFGWTIWFANGNYTSATPDGQVSPPMKRRERRASRRR